MIYASHHCPVCGDEVPREIQIFLAHAEQHILDVLKRDHPEWMTSDGSCEKCQEYYYEQLVNRNR